MRKARKGRKDSSLCRVYSQVMLRMTDSGSNAVFMEQGSSASQMMAEKVLDVMARQPGCAGQASDGVSAATQVKMKDALELLKLPKSECPDFWVRLPRYKWPNSWSNMEDPVVPFERNFCGHPLAGLLWARKFERIVNGTWMGSSTELGMPICFSRTRFILIGVRGCLKMAGKKQYGSQVEEGDEECGSWRTNIIS